MSYNIIHILKHNSFLCVDRGFLVLKSDKEEKRTPLSDLLIIIVAARGVGFSGNSFSEILKSGATILHCNEKYKPIGKTIGLPYIIHSNIFEKQIEKDKLFCINLWNKIIKTKVENQAKVLDLMKLDHKLYEYIKDNDIDEGNCARHYWKKYFSKFGRNKPMERERYMAEHPVNQMLNYAYAVMGAISHRSIIAHGLNPCLGIHHKYRFKSEPLLYDLMEPLRPFCDLILFRFREKNLKKDLTEFTKVVSENFINLTFKIFDKKLKMINVIDKYISSVADSFYYSFPEKLYIPQITDIYE